MAREGGEFGPLALTPAAARLLSPAQGALEAPIRSVLFGAARFSEHGRSLASAQRVAAPGSAPGSFFPRLQDNLRALRDARAVLEDHARQGHHLAPASTWLIDHGLLLETQFDTVKRDLPRRYFAQLPRLRDAPLAGLPRVYGLAWAWVAHSDSGMDEDLLEVLLGAYQSQSELTLAELWAFPTTLRVVLIENLRRLAERAATTQAARDAAHRWVERTPEPGDEQRLAALGEALARRDVLEAFALQLQRRSEDFDEAAAPGLRAWLAAHLEDPADALQRQHRQAAEDHQSVRNAVTTLRALDRVDWRGVLLRSCASLAALQRLPVFAAESESTQDLTLHDVERLARRAALPESRVCLALARLAGGSSGAASAPQYWLRGPGRPVLLRELGSTDGLLRWRTRARQAATPAYLLTLLAGTVGLVALVLHGPAAATGTLSPLAWWLSALLLAGPAGETVVAVLHRLISESLPPRQLPRLALQDGIPALHQVLVVVPAMLTQVAGVHELARQLEQHHLANPESHAQFALLSDWADAPQQQMPGDEALLAAARQALERLNRRHPVAPGQPLRFLLLHRERVWSDTEQCWMGWERKRGKIEQLLVWLAEPGARSGAHPFVDLGPLSAPALGTRHLLALDSDTVMPPGRLRELVAVAAHPLNAPVLDAQRRRVVSGYGILQPRVVVPLPDPAARTAFHWMFSGQWGVDPYSAASSEIYQDVFGEGTYVGKGLLDVAAVHAVLAHRLPPSQVLSHDLLEGSLARCAAVSDVTLVEDAPAHPDVAASRLHRWTRGDWQLLPFILHPRRWPMAGINRWKMVDNLRRSLVAPASLALLAWALATGAVPLPAALLLVAAAYGAGPLLGAVASLAPPRDDIALGLFFSRTGTELLRAGVGLVWQLLQLLAQAMLSLDAVARALLRQFVTRRSLLQWTTAAAAQAAVSYELPALLRRHRRVVLGAGALLLALLAALAWRGVLQAPPDTPFWGSPAGRALAWCVLWGAAPLWIWLASLRIPAPALRLADTDRERVRKLAQDTWSLYARYVGEEDHHLPPDNVQFSSGEPMVAHRTSPTNIGLYLLAVAAARELGFIANAEMLGRLENTLDTLDRLPRWRGHFYNWYDTQSLVTLPPAYVSTVDSGNLSGHLLVLAAACEQRARQMDPADPAHAADSTAEDAAAAAAPATPGPHEGTLPARLLRVAARARTLALAADYAVLYDPRRRLLHIGMDVDAQRLDSSHYDLLASEARLASLVAIAKGDVPPRHWSVLGRPVFAAGNLARGFEVGLKSWSGSMFEYLMPSLVLEEPAGSLLYQATRTAVAAQRAEAAAHGTPWGISESAIAAQDHTLAYQYGPQGAPQLALRRTPADERVVAPYASVMALMVAPQAAADNLAALERLGARRSLGFIEALDYTPRRQPVGSAQGFTPVLTFMAHHQAMSLLACTHVLTGGAVHRWAALSPHLRAVLPLLHERAPHQAPPLRAAHPSPPLRPLAGQRWQFESRPRRSALPPTHLLGNDRYAVVLRANGAGYSQWQGQGLTRWRDDALRDEHGLFGYLCREGDAHWSPLSANPAPPTVGAEHAGMPAEYRCEFHPDRVQLHARFADLVACTTVSVSPTDDCELRQVRLHNPGRRPLRVRLAMALEPTLAPQRADEAHPAFSNLFVQARWADADRALFLQRRPRLAGDPVVHAVHFLAACDDPLARVTAIADRATWLGRLGSVAQPLLPLAAAAAAPALAADPAGHEPERERATGLDPVSVLCVEITVPAQGSRTLSFVLGAANDEATLRSLVDRWQQPAQAERAQGLSDTLARIRLRELRLTPDTWAAWLHLNTLLVSQFSRPQPLPGPGTDRRTLWRHSIGGERPILVLWLQGSEGLDLARELVSMLALWATAGQALDLVMINAEPASYDAPVQQACSALREAATLRIGHVLPADRRPALVLLQARELQAAEIATLRLLARVWLQADGRPLAQQMERVRAPLEEDLAERRSATRQAVLVPQAPAQAGPPAAGGAANPAAAAAEEAAAVARGERGRFDPDDAAFGFVVTPGWQPPQPWVNVLANPGFGCIVSEATGGYTWAGNSRLHQITAGANDPLRDPPVEALWLHDLDTQRVWWLGRGASRREVVHGLGSTRMRQTVAGLEVELTWCVDVQHAVRQLRVKVSALPGASAPRELRLVGFAEWTLGGSRTERATVLTRPYRWLAPPALRATDEGVGLAVLATQSDASAGQGGATAFLCWRVDSPEARAPAAAPAAWLELDDWTCDRREFFDNGGRWVLPAQLRGRWGAGLDPCGAVACRLQVSPGRAAQAALLLGHADSVEAATRLAQEACAVAPAERLARQVAQWPALLDRVTVRTPDPRFDALVNRWLPYQAISCRIWARAGYYQAGGAYGFRDQLQDAMNLALRLPQFLLQQARLHAARQFAEGDVQHWWHPPLGAGVRTHISDDLLWLPLALVHALQHCGAEGAALLDETLPFLRGAAVPPGAEDIYETPTVGDEAATLYEHGARAIDHCLQRRGMGAHGLPLMGTGDWNDGMNRVGHEGRGESVWLGWFLCRVIADYAPVAQQRGEGARAAAWLAARDALTQALEHAGWDGPQGRWYRRAYFDDGSPLGSASNAECRIDLIAQAWSVLAGNADPAHAEQALQSARALLWDDAAGVLRLLHPPLAQAEPEAGYIQAYPPGIRENGGQYNHGAVWALMAFAQQGDGAWAWRVFEALSPAHRSAHAQRGAVYALEPYVLAGDIYTQPPYAGRGGWSWYTGAASWLQRAALESICGLELQATRLLLHPCLPPHWPGLELQLRHAGRSIVVSVQRAPAEGPGPTPPAQSRRVEVDEWIDLDGLPDGSRLLLVLDSPHGVMPQAPHDSDAAAPPPPTPEPAGPEPVEGPTANPLRSP